MNINNVYDEVTFFFDGDLEYLPMDIDQDLIEGFLRQKAWQGAKDADLRDIWGNLKLFLSYLSYSCSMNIEEISHSEYSLIIEWIGVQTNSNPSLPATRRFFSVLEDFYSYLAAKKIISEEAAAQLKRAREIMTGGKKLQFIEPDYEFSPFDKMDEADLSHIHRIVPENISRMIGEAVERLMLKFSSYFQQDQFAEDFDRALMLYAGPLGDPPGEEGKKEDGDDFWLGFWDYFLFDYHLLKNDLTPLAKFNSSYKNKVSSEEKKILNDLLAARFTVFYVDSIISQDWVLCVNLFTQEQFRLPNPNFDYKLIKKMLFFGHVFLQQEGREFVMINFITSVEISLNLRKRIKEETERQKTIFNMQNPEADWDDFLARHANIVRHTIDLLASSAKVNVTPYTHVERVFPTIPDATEVFEEQSSLYRVYLEVDNLIAKHMPKFTYSIHDIILAKKLWRDYCCLAGGDLGRLRNLSAWAAAIIYAYSLINAGDDCLALSALGEEMDVKKSSVSQNQAKVAECLQLMKFDPRYLSEEGFVYLLYQ